MKKDIDIIKEKEEKRTPKPRAAVGAALMAAGLLALVVCLVSGAASFDGSEPEKLTVTRACGAVSFIGAVIYMGYRPTRRAAGVGVGAAAAAVLPALAVAVNNAPLIPLLMKDAAVTADAGQIFSYAVESLMIGLFEETAFRGVLLLAVVDSVLARMERAGKNAAAPQLFAAALVTSAIFGALHLFNLFGGASVGGTLLQAGYSFLIGGMCSLVLLMSGSLASCVLIHAVYDFGGYLVPRLGEGKIWTPPEIILTAAVGVAAAAYYLLSSAKLGRSAAERMCGRRP